jgi:hypothetical protein
LQALAKCVYEHAEELAIAAVQETGMGNVRDKTAKNRFASLDIYRCNGYFAHPFVKWMILPVNAALSRARALECKGVFLRYAEVYAVPLLLLQR